MSDDIGRKETDFRNVLSQGGVPQRRSAASARSGAQDAAAFLEVRGAALQRILELLMKNLKDAGEFTLFAFRKMIKAGFHHGWQAISSGTGRADLAPCRGSGYGWPVKKRSKSFNYRGGENWPSMMWNTKWNRTQKNEAGSRVTRIGVPCD
jgi:hypothetical protein